MRRINSTNNHRWLKAIIIIAVIAVAALLLMREYLILVELVACVLGGYIAYRVIKHRIENPKQQRQYKTIEAPEVKVREIKRQVIDNEEIDEFDISKLPPEILYKEVSKVSSKILLEVLTDRGEVRIR